MSDEGISAHAQRVHEEVRRLRGEVQRLSDQPDAVTAAPSALAEPLRQTFADLAALCELLAQTAPYSIHQGSLRETVSALRGLDHQWYTIKLHSGCSGVV